MEQLQTKAERKELNGFNESMGLALCPHKILRQLPRTVLDEAGTQDDPWSWLAKWVKCNPIEHRRVGTVEMRDAECAVLQKEGFKRTGTGIYQADPATRHNAKIYQGVHEI